MTKILEVAIAGNPNVGKTTLFNALTGTHQHVGNWPGKTVEKKEGCMKYNNRQIKIIDLPGIYSLNAYSIEEIVARNYVVNEKPDVVIQIINSCNIERNLYLTVQLLELGANVIIALNMGNIAKKNGTIIDEKKISHFLNVPVVKIEANKNIGIDKLMDEAMAFHPKNKSTTPLITYGTEIEEHLAKIEKLLAPIDLPKEYHARWVAIKLLENDSEVYEKILQNKGGRQILENVGKERKHLTTIFGEDTDNSIADARYGFIAGVVKEGVEKKEINRLSTSENIDKIFMNRVLGIPIFLALLWLMFTLTFSVGAPITDLISNAFGWLSKVVTAFITAFGGPAWLQSFVADSIIGGIGSVLIFIPNIFILFFLIALMEDSGYMARAAYIMDKLMHKIGLHGKSFIPMIIGFGCNVPAIMATRTLENENDRLKTILINPFVSCSARLPVYVLFVSAFFNAYQGTIIFLIYLLGIAIAIISGLIFKKTIFKGLSSPLIMELPPYRWPTIKGAAIHAWERGILFIKKAGTIILGVVVLIWFLSSMPVGVEYASQQSFLGNIGTVIAPIFEPCGFGNWQSAVSLLCGFAAKEVIIGTFGTIYGVENEGLTDAITNHFTPLSAAAFIVMTLLYVPCVAVIATIKRETNSWKWPLFVILYTSLIAWIAATIVYQGGLLLGFV